MKQPKLVVGFLMDDEMIVKAAKIPKPAKWLTQVEIEDLVEFFEGLLELTTRISEGKEDSESLPIFLGLWREAALEAKGDETEVEGDEPFWETLTNSIQRAMNHSGHSIFVGFDEEVEEDDELISPLINIVDGQSRQKGIMHDLSYGEPVVVDVTEEERDDYLAQRISELGLSTRAYNCLIRENISTLRELVVKADWDLLEYSGFGHGSLYQVKHQLATRGLFLGMDLDDEDYEDD